MIQIKTGHVFIAGILGLIVMNGPKLGAMAEIEADVSAQRIHSDRVARLQKEDARRLAALSEVALERAKSCINVVDPRTKGPLVFVEGQPVWANQSKGIPIVNRPVCNSAGDTAISNGSGLIEAGSIASVTPADLPRYTAIRNGENPDAAK